MKKVTVNTTNGYTAFVAIDGQEMAVHCRDTGERFEGLAIFKEIGALEFPASTFDHLPTENEIEGYLIK